MKVLDFMNSNCNWEETLSNPPYSITIKKDEDLTLLKYQQLNSEMSLPIVRECRGSIFQQGADGKWRCVCYPFDKFGNYGEGYTPLIDWSSARVEEKVDGSLIKFYYLPERGWQIATNGLPNARKAETNGFYTFYQLVELALGGSEQLNKFIQHLSPDYTYMFELVSPESRTTIYYPETKLYYLGQRNLLTEQEEKNYTDFMIKFGILVPKVYNLTSLEECLQYVNQMTKDEEGFVVCDKFFNRIKIKSPEYLLSFHLVNNNVITPKRIINMAKNEMLDDFLAYCPQYSDKVELVLAAIRQKAKEMEEAWATAPVHLDRKEFAEATSKNPYRHFLFRKYDNNSLKAIDFIMGLWTKQVLKLIK